MTQLSPTALEEAAKAISISTGDEPDKLTYAREMQCSGADREPQYRWQYWTEHATAAITAYLAQAEKEGWVMVPRDLTPDMIVQGYEHVNRDLCEGRGNALNRLWDAMLAAVQNGEDRPAPPMGK